MRWGTAQMDAIHRTAHRLVLQAGEGLLDRG
jgi:cyclopropane fatty-acyl-phospholipid synthase-like methyltransferase